MRSYRDVKFEETLKRNPDLAEFGAPPPEESRSSRWIGNAVVIAVGGAAIAMMTGFMYIGLRVAGAALSGCW